MPVRSYVEARHALNTTAYRELAEATGELLPGIEAVVERKSVRVRLGCQISHAGVTEGGAEHW